MSTCPFCGCTVKSDAQYCAKCGARLTQNADDMDLQIRSLVEQGKKIQAVKLYKNRAGVSLKLAKDAVDAIERGEGASVVDKGDTDVEADVCRLLNQGEKLRAVKLYRENNGTSLLEAKRAVEALATRYGIADQGAGAAGMFIALGIVAVLLITLIIGLIMLNQ